jgi:hypothetical protein
VTARVITSRVKHAIDLLILQSHSSYELQPLDVGLFAPLKRALARDTDEASRLDCGRIPRAEWTEMYIELAVEC